MYGRMSVDELMCLAGSHQDAINYNKEKSNLIPM